MTKKKNTQEYLDEAWQKADIENEKRQLLWEERIAWDRYMAAALSNGGSFPDAISLADKILNERRKRFPLD